jgi:hypothetical protein
MAQHPRALTERSDTRAAELDQIQQRVDDLQAAIGRDVRELESRVRSAFDPRLQIARHPFVAAAVVVGAVFVVTRIVQSVLRRVRGPGGDESRLRRSTRSRVFACRPGRRSDVRGAHQKEALE